MLVTSGLKHEYEVGTVRTAALNGVSCSFDPGSFTAIMGPSGSGKSTLLHCLAGLLKPTGGSVTFEGAELGKLRKGKLARLRRDDFGFVFQDYNLLEALTAEQNIMFPSVFGGQLVTREDAREALAQVSLEKKAKFKPAELSGGHQQRVAIARALARKRKVVFADEPTGALDRKTGNEVMELFAGVAESGTAVIVVTHDPGAAAYADRILMMRDGEIIDGLEDEPEPHPRIAPAG